MASRHEDWWRQAEKDLEHARHAVDDADYEWAWDSVEIEYFPSGQVWEALSSFVSTLRRQHPEVATVILFGSVVRGDSVPGSDVDLLVVLGESSIPFLDRIPRYLPSSFPVGVDVFPYTCDELEQMLSQGNTFIQEALAEGREV
jgi:predicted nucleotidyltransferase